MFFFFEVPRKFQSPQRITSLGGFLAGESSKYFRARKVTLGHVEEVIEGNPTLWLCLKVTPYRGWYMGTGLAEKPWKVGKSKSKSTDRNELMPCVVWLACWKWWKTCESGKPCTSLRGFLWNHRQLHPFQHSTWVLVWEVFKMPVQTGMNEGLKKISRRLPRAFSGVSFFLYKPNCHQIQTYGFLEQVQVMIYFSHKLIRISFPKTGWREVVSKSLLRCRGSSSII